MTSQDISYFTYGTRLILIINQCEISFGNHLKTEVVYLYNPRVSFPVYRAGHGACGLLCRLLGCSLDGDQIQEVFRFGTGGLLNGNAPALCHNPSVDKIHIILDDGGEKSLEYRH